MAAPGDRATILSRRRRCSSDPAARAALSGRIVLIGSSAPELGGLRVTPASPATPSVRIQAEAIETILRGGIPSRSAWLGPGRTGCAALLGLLVSAAGGAGCGLPPAAMLAVLGLPRLDRCRDRRGARSLLAGRSCRPSQWWRWPASPLTLARFARDEWRARLLRASFEQHLAPDVVRRIAADPAALRLRGEMREITALFTDIEGFTSMTERADPTDLVALLDTYFDVAARIVDGSWRHDRQDRR